MFSKDIDQLISYIDTAIAAATKTINSLGPATKYQLVSSAEHAGTAFGHCAPVEVAVPYSLNLAPYKNLKKSLKPEIKKYDQIGDEIAQGKSQFQTSIGSPWNEIDRFYAQLEIICNEPTTLNFVGDKAGTLSEFNALLSLAIDAKYAVINAHDTLARGYDYKFNGKKPSITWQNSVDGSRTMGNIGKQKQKENNVHIEEPSNDPY